jgi:hypothetical protein
MSTIKWIGNRQQDEQEEIFNAGIISRSLLEAIRLGVRTLFDLGVVPFQAV